MIRIACLVAASLFTHLAVDVGRSDAQPYAMSSPKSQLKTVSKCYGASDALLVSPLPSSVVEPSIKYLQKTDKHAHNIKLFDASLVSGKCATSVTALVMDKVGLKDGSVHQFTANGLVSWPISYSDMFDRTTLSALDVPNIPGAEFVYAVPITPLSTGTGLRTRYVSLWAQNGGGLIVDFTVPAGGGKAVNVRPLLRSSLPLRSVAYFPSPDTQSGGLYVVQAASSSEIRAISFTWWHRK